MHVFSLPVFAEIRNKYDQKTGRKVSAQRGKRLSKRALNAELKRRRNAPFNAGLGENGLGWEWCMLMCVAWDGECVWYGLWGLGWRMCVV